LVDLMFRVEAEGKAGRQKPYNEEEVTIEHIGRRKTLRLTKNLKREKNVTRVTNSKDIVETTKEGTKGQVSDPRNTGIENNHEMGSR